MWWIRSLAMGLGDVNVLQMMQWASVDSNLWCMSWSSWTKMALSLICYLLPCSKSHEGSSKARINYRQGIHFTHATQPQVFQLDTLQLKGWMSFVLLSWKESFQNQPHIHLCWRSPSGVPNGWKHQPFHLVLAFWLSIISQYWGWFRILHPWCIIVIGSCSLSARRSLCKYLQKVADGSEVKQKSASWHHPRFVWMKLRQLNVNGPNTCYQSIQVFKTSI